jgi:hypothetical protein
MPSATPRTEREAALVAHAPRCGDIVHAFNAATAGAGLDDEDTDIERFLVDEVCGVIAYRDDCGDYACEIVDALTVYKACVSVGHGRVGATMTTTAPRVGAARVAVEAMTLALGGVGEVVNVEVLSNAEADGSADRPNRRLTECVAAPTSGPFGSRDATP